MNYIIWIMIILIAWLSQCSPEYYVCEGYKLKPVTEIPARCLSYYK